MQQLDVQAEETSELEVEVARLLHEQGAGAEKQMVHGERPFEPSGESAPSGSAQENKKHQEQSASPKVDEQREDSNGTLLLTPEPPNQEAKATVSDIAAALT